MSDAQTPETPDTTDAVLEGLWRRALEEWDEPKRHVALLEHALTVQQLPDLAGRYRALKDDPQKGNVAKKRLDAIVVAATQLLMATATPRTEKSKVLPVLTLIAGIMLVATLTWFARAVLLQGR